MGYGYDKDGKTFSYKMGTNNANLLLKGAKKVPKGTLFFIGENGQLYMRTGPYLEGDGKFMFGPGIEPPIVPAKAGTIPRQVGEAPSVPDDLVARIPARGRTRQ